MLASYQQGSDDLLVDINFKIKKTSKDSYKGKVHVSGLSIKNAIKGFLTGFGSFSNGNKEKMKKYGRGGSLADVINK